MATNIIEGGFKRQEIGEGTCKEDDGCPTEKAVLQRFWREHHKQAATEAAKATGTAGEQWKPKALQGPRKSIFYGGNTNEHLNPLVVLISAEDYEKCCSLCEAPRVPHEMAYTVGGVADVSYVNGWNDCRDTVLGKIDDDPTNAPAEAARQPAPVADQLKLICAGFGWRTDGDSNVLADRIEHHIRDLKAGIKARDTMIAERDAALAATAAPVRNEADERDNEIFDLQKALAFWLPQVNQFMSDEMSQRIAHDAYMLVIDGNLPDDFKTAQELGWILPATGKVQRDAEMVCGNCMEPIAATNRSQP